MKELFFLGIALFVASLPFDRILSFLYFHSKTVSQRLDNRNHFFYMAKLPFVKGMSYFMSVGLGFGVLYLQDQLYGVFWHQLAVLIGMTLLYVWSPFNYFKPRGLFWFYIGVYAFLGLPLLIYYLIVLGMSVLLTRSWVLGLVSTFVVMYLIMLTVTVPTEYYFVQFWLLFVVVLRYLDEIMDFLDGRNYPALDKVYFSR
jgi:hypothetical protein